MRRSLIAVVIAVGGAGLLAAPVEAAEKQRVPPSARAYIKAGALNTVRGGEAMQRAASPGSLADAAATVRTDFLRAARDHGQPFPPSTATFTRTGATLCSTGETRECSDFADFRMRRGKVANYTKNGFPLDGTLSLGDGSTHDALDAGLTVEGASMTLSDPDNLVVVVGVENGSRQLAFNYVGDYVDADGRRVASVAELTPQEDLRSDESTTLVFAFPDVSPGGRVVVRCFDEAASEGAETEMPVPVFVP